MELAKSNSGLISLSGDYKYLHWLVYSGANCWLLSSDTSWEASVVISDELATPVLYSVPSPKLFRGHTVSITLNNIGNGKESLFTGLCEKEPNIRPPYLNKLPKPPNVAIS